MIFHFISDPFLLISLTEKIHFDEWVFELKKKKMEASVNDECNGNLIWLVNKGPFEAQVRLISESSSLHIHHQAHEASQPSLFSKGVMIVECNVSFLKLYVQRQLS
jgi:hypothetical protein